MLPPIDMAIAWHGRLMVLAWVFLFPAGILIARYFKVTPRQKWPEELDNQFWWLSHLVLQNLGGLAVLCALILILLAPEDTQRQGWVHRWLGWSVITLCVAQFLSALVRGTRGGPTNANPNSAPYGDHFDMSLRRRVFEVFHRGNGYLLLLLSAISVTTGLASAVAPDWMLPLIVVWWLLYLALFVYLHRRGYYIGSYQAIWGPAAQPPERRLQHTSTPYSTVETMDTAPLESECACDEEPRHD